jgi:hypothetical protein
MMVERGLARELASFLDEWRTWAEGGGMSKGNFERIEKNQEIFAYASLFVSLIGSVGETVEGTLATDLQEAIRMWRNVRLG